MWTRLSGTFRPPSVRSESLIAVPLPSFILAGFNNVCILDAITTPERKGLFLKVLREDFGLKSYGTIGVLFSRSLMPKLTLRPFQAEDVAFIRKNDYRVLIANAPGTGKTIECLACLKKDRKKLTPMVVVCPPSVAHNWRRETKKWCQWAKVYIVKGHKIRLPRKHIDVIIVPWSILAARYLEILARKPQFLVVDEAHFAKNEEALEAKPFRSLPSAHPTFFCLREPPSLTAPKNWRH